MSLTTSAPHRVLFVDNDALFLNNLETAFRRWAGDTWKFSRAANAAEAFRVLDAQLIDLVVVEPDLPGLDGMQFLHLLKRRFAHIPQAVLAAHPAPTAKDAALKAGAQVYLEKPKGVEATEIIFRTLNELAQWRPLSGFRGMLHCSTLHEILQIECLNQSTALMEVVSGTTFGRVYFRDGAILHAHADHHKGAMALAYLLTLKGGEFYLKPFAEPPEITVEGPWEALLMNAAQTRDEEGTAFFQRPVKREAALENWEATGIPSVRNETDEAMFAAKTEELLVWSENGEVLLSLHCAMPESRASFLDFLAKKSEKLTASFGKLEQFELRDKDYRVIGKFTEGNKVFTRVSRSA